MAQQEFLLPEKPLAEVHLLLFQSLPLEVAEELVITRMQQEVTAVPEAVAFIRLAQVEPEIIPPHPYLKEIPEGLEVLMASEADPEAVIMRLAELHPEEEVRSEELGQL